MSVAILINALPAPQAVPIANLVNLSEAAGGWVSYAWTLLDRPEGSSAFLTGSTTATPTITPDCEGTYLILLVVNAGQNTRQQVMAVFYVSRLIDDRRDPAAGETTEANLVRGWAEAANRQLTDISDLRKDAGRQAGVIDFNGSAANYSVLYVAGTTVLKSTLPGQESVPTFGSAEASDPVKMSGSLYLLERGVTSGASPAANDVVWARLHGMAYGVPLAATVAGIPVYVDDAGGIAVAPGTYHRCIGRVATARMNDCDVEFDGHVQFRQRGTVLRFGSRSAGTNVLAGYNWPLAFGYQTEPPTAALLYPAGVRLRYYPSKPGRWSRLTAWANFAADPRTVDVAVWKNDVLTSLSVTLNSPGGAGPDGPTNDFDELHAVTFEVGDEIDVRVTNATAIIAATDLNGIAATVYEQLFE